MNTSRPQMNSKERCYQVKRSRHSGDNLSECEVHMGDIRVVPKEKHKLK
jgi:hypothetical protein